MLSGALQLFLWGRGLWIPRGCPVGGWAPGLLVVASGASLWLRTCTSMDEQVVVSLVEVFEKGRGG